jgi:glycosyltransferase involved in cell wall biosynthesis
MVTLYCVCLAIVVYVYFGYPLLLRIGAFGARREFPTGQDQPLISVLVAAHNEEPTIETKLKNLLASDYPREHMEILIGSDGSSDRTEEIVRPYAAEGVGLISFPSQQGKSAMQNGLVAASSGAILVFTDADCFFAPGAIPRLVAAFADPSVGLVTGRPLYENESESRICTNESLYLRYETWLREQESARGLLAMASGSLFAMRRSLWKRLDANVGDDFVLPLKVIEAGYHNILDPHVIAITRLEQCESDSMLALKIRIISKDFRALLTHRELLNPLRYGAMAMGLWSHKLLRWLIPHFLLTLLVANFFLLANPFFRAALAIQGAAFALASIGAIFGNKGQRIFGHTSQLWSLPLSFCVVNLAALIGTFKCLAGYTSGQWKPERKHSPA